MAEIKKYANEETIENIVIQIKSLFSPIFHQHKKKDIIDFPIIPTKYSELIDDVGIMTNIPVGAIVVWSGNTSNIPSGWQLCDGTNDTPDLRDRFVVGAGNLYEVGDVGGEAETVLTVDTMPSHSHISRIFNKNNQNYDAQIVPAGFLQPNELIWSDSEFKTAGEGGVGDPCGVSSETGNSQPHNNLPPYYALCYIMRTTNTYLSTAVMNDIVDEVLQALPVWEGGEY